MPLSRCVKILLSASILASAGLLYVGLFVIVRPAFPDYTQATALCKGCPQPFLDLYYEGLVNDYNQMTLVPRTIAQVGIGLIVGMLCAFLILSGTFIQLSLRPLDSQDAAQSSRRGRFSRILGAILLVAGIAGFAILGFSGIYFDNTGDRKSAAFGVILLADSIFGNHVGFSIMATLLLGIGTLGAALMWSAEGLGVGIKRSIAFISAPSAVLFTTGIRLFDDREMSIHATNLLVGVSVNHTDLVSNWTVLVVSGILVAAGLAGIVRALPRPRSPLVAVAVCALLFSCLALAMYAMATQ